MKKILKIIVYFQVAIFLLVAFNSIQIGTGFTFNKNLLISDSTFINYNSMSKEEIQHFLEQHNSFLAKYKQNGIPASEIIFNAAKKYKINPQVILTTMQKEEGLITKHVFDEYALNFAMGYHSPSSFKQQIYDGTKLLRDGYDFLAEKYGWKIGVPHTTKDSPKYVDNTVTPQNKATASLYLYTPYIGGYYTDSGSYIGGNYNFVKIFLRWFKDIADSKAVYPSFDITSCTFYVPRNTNSTITVKLRNNSKEIFDKQFFIASKNSIPQLNIKSTQVNFSFAPETTKEIFVIIPPVNNPTIITFGIMNTEGKFVSNTCTIKVVPTNLKFYFNEVNKKMIFNVVAEDVYIKYAYLNISFNSDPESPVELLNAHPLGNKQLKITISSFPDLQTFSVSFIGTNQKLSNVLPAVFLSGLKKDSPQLTINTFPANAAIELDDKLILNSPVKINLPKGMHTVTILQNKTTKYTFNLLYSENLAFNLNSNESNPPTISIFNGIKATNSSNIEINGRVYDRSKINSFKIGNTNVKLNPDGTFEKSVTLNYGVNIINLTAIDQYKNSTTVLYKIIFENKIPQLFIADPPHITANEFLKISINTENVSALYINNKPSKQTNCVKFIKLSLGKNTIQIIGISPYGTKVEKKFTVVYSPLPKIHLLLQINSKIMYVNGNKKIMDVAPIIRNNRTLLPIRHVIEALHGQVEWFPKDKRVEIQINGAEIMLLIGKNIAMVNGEKIPIDKNSQVVPFIKNNRTYLPLRFIIEQIDGTVTWVPETKEIKIEYPKY
jgi:hypothetical protein